MKEIDNQHFIKSENDINISEIFEILLNQKKAIIFITFLFSIIGVIYSLSLPNIYQSKALLVPIDPSSNISRSIQNFGSLASLGGIGLNSAVADTNSQKAILKLGSLSFFENNILPNIYLPNLMATKYWDPAKNIIIYHSDVYDEITGKWTRDYSYPQKQIPSAQEGFKKFTTDHFNLTEDKINGNVTISIKHQSPFIAKKWTELLIDEVNAFYRYKDKTESQKTVSYLNQQISMTGLSEIKEAIAALLQEETKKLALVEANEYYVFEYIDPPAVMEEKSEPSRALICILFALIGGFFAASYVLIRYFFFQLEPRGIKA